MADKNPFANLGLGQLGSERQYMTPFFSPEERMKMKRGAMGAAFQAIGAEGFFNKMFGKEAPAPEGAVPPQDYKFTKDFSSGLNYQMDQARQRLGFVPGSIPSESPSTPAPSIDDENDAAWGNKKMSEFTPRDTSQDQLPQQFASYPVVPPTMQYPQLPQMGGASRMYAAFA